MPTLPIRHVVFSMSAAGSLRQALSLPTGRHDKRVIGCPDDLSFGPINPPNAEARVAWGEQVLGISEPDGEPGFWSGRINCF